MCIRDSYGTVTIFFNFFGDDIGTQTFFWDDLNILSSSVTSVEGSDGDIPEKFALKQNYPNPFNPSTVISYEISNSVHVNVSVYNMLGQKVATLVNERQNAGSKEVRFDAKSFTSGVYIYRIQAGRDVYKRQPKGYELPSEFMGDLKPEYNQAKAFEGADFVYAKNWSSYTEYGQILSTNASWMVSKEKMSLTNNARFMHCLPVRRNQVVEDAVIDSENSLVIEEAANRIVSMQTVLKKVLENL